MRRVRKCVLAALMLGVLSCERESTAPRAGGVLFASIAAGFNHTCGLTAGGAAYCWGDNTTGELGDGTDTPHLMPIAVHGGIAFASLTTGPSETCGLTPDGVAYCWGADFETDMGWIFNGPTTARATPKPVAGGLVFTSLTAGWYDNCGLTSAGAAYCWGSDIGVAPTLVPGGVALATVSVGDAYNCGVTVVGAAYCWGSLSLDGELGDGLKSPHTAPTLVAGGVLFANVTTSYDHTCGLTTGGAAYCWGNNYFGDLGDGTTTDRSVPTPVQGGLVFTSLALGDNYTCGLTGAGAAYCWGFNGSGELGDGSMMDHHTPVAVRGGLVFSRLSGGGNEYACGLTMSGASYCWGYNADGELGDGTTTNRSTPTAVIP